MPKSEAEANNVDEIVRMFRFYMAPSFEGDISSSRTMIVPATFDITYMNMNKEKTVSKQNINLCFRKCKCYIWW